MELGELGSFHGVGADGGMRVEKRGDPAIERSAFPGARAPPYIGRARPLPHAKSLRGKGDHIT